MKPAELLEMSVQEKENIVSQTVSTYGGRLMAFIRPKVNSQEDAEDILQEVWYQFSNLTNLKDIVNVSSWLYSVTRNKITDNYRKKKPEQLEDFFYEDEEGSFIIQEFLTESTEDNPEMKLVQQEIWNEIFLALDELSEKQRLVFIQNEIEGKTLQQIADEQIENIKTIISRKNYAVKHLRNRLDNLYKEITNN